MAGIKGRGGQPGRSGKHTNHYPRQPHSVKALQPLYDAIKAASAMFDPPGQPVADVTALAYCPGCGAWGWKTSHIRVWGADYGVVAGATPLADVPLAGQVMRHGKKCKFG